MIAKFVFAILDRTDLLNNWLETHYYCTSPRLVLDLLEIRVELLLTDYFKLAALSLHDPVADVGGIEDSRIWHIVESNELRLIIGFDPLGFARVGMHPKK